MGNLCGIPESGDMVAESVMEMAIISVRVAVISFVVGLLAKKSLG